VAEPRRTVTALRPAGPSRFAVELDGAPWRTLPREVVHRAGLVVGLELDRERLRMLRRELRRSEALGAALTALRYRDHSRASLTERLERRGVAPAQRLETLGVLSRAGMVDDQRVAYGRAAALATRGAGDRLIADDLARKGIAPDLIAAALAALEPERERAARVVEQRGRSPRTARYLAAQGFSQETLEPLLERLVADFGGDAIG
jgi:SOS response regulatory protein OraA/RecX